MLPSRLKNLSIDKTRQCINFFKLLCASCMQSALELQKNLCGKFPLHPPLIHGLVCDQMKSRGLWMALYWWKEMTVGSPVFSVANIFVSCQTDFPWSPTWWLTSIRYLGPTPQPANLQHDSCMPTWRRCKWWHKVQGNGDAASYPLLKQMVKVQIQTNHQEWLFSAPCCVHCLVHRTNWGVLSIVASIFSNCSIMELEGISTSAGLDSRFTLFCSSRHRSARRAALYKAKRTAAPLFYCMRLWFPTILTLKAGRW